MYIFSSDLSVEMYCLKEYYEVITLCNFLHQRLVYERN